MDTIAQTLAWLSDPVHWQGGDGIPTRLIEHVRIAAVALAAAIAVALPVGLYIGHTGRGAVLAVNLSNLGRAIPSFAVLSLAFPIALRAGLGVDPVPTLVALFALSLPPIVTNTYVGLREVDREVVEAGRGMGMREREILARVEVPLALPVILTGLRVAAVQVVATATLGAVVGGGGLGRYIVDGFARQENERILAGALLVALLAIATELAFGVMGRALVSRGLRVQAARPSAITEPAQTMRPGAGL